MKFHVAHLDGKRIEEIPESGSYQEALLYARVWVQEYSEFVSIVRPKYWLRDMLYCELEIKDETGNFQGLYTGAQVIAEREQSIKLQRAFQKREKRKAARQVKLDSSR